MIEPLLIKVATLADIGGANHWLSEPVKPGELWRIRFIAVEAGATRATQFFVRVHGISHDHLVYSTSVLTNTTGAQLLTDFWMREGEWLDVQPYGQVADDTAFFLISGDLIRPDNPPAADPAPKTAGQSYG